MIERQPGSVGDDVNELHSDTLWRTMKRLARKSSLKRAAVAYVTSDEVVRFNDGDIPGDRCQR
jgi:hypothetical protein